MVERFFRDLTGRRLRRGKFRDVVELIVSEDDAGAAGPVRAVDVEDDVGAGEDEVIVAAFERGSAEIGGGEVALLDHGSHCAVEHKDAGGEGIFERLLARAIQREVLEVKTDGWKKRPVVLL